MGVEDSRVSGNWRERSRRLRLEAKAYLTKAEVTLLLENGVTASQLLSYTRERLEQLLRRFQQPALQSGD